ncbi:VacJ family lipoprotein [Methylocaldum sp.]|uniref:MlaA family lipoprotein n=1 Tax=Methylocaldum sp. TaxID=1969727 RepID=UPI002D38B485|nr:VacJ family lipoprotein [Methylocaldum sp.]HYE35405.1 VacJ family lipoprotein [Methylocaldum sp.]
MKPTPKMQAKRAVLVTLLSLGLTACATATKTDPRDPWEDWNRDVQSFNDDVDQYVMKPVAKGYKWIVPSVVDQGVTNFYSNINDIAVFLNDFLQLKPLQGGEDAGRFMINTVAGLGGIFDVATYVGLPKHREDFDQTLAVWGIPSGPYLVLPLFGPSTPRGVGGLIGDSATNPINYFAPMVVPFISSTINVTDQKADHESESKILDVAAQDRYEFIRNSYFQERADKIHDGNPPLDEELEKAEEELDRDVQEH